MSPRCDPLTLVPLCDHLPDWQPRILQGMVEARSVNNVKNTTTTIQGDSCVSGAVRNTLVVRISLFLHIKGSQAGVCYVAFAGFQWKSLGGRGVNYKQNSMEIHLLLDPRSLSGLVEQPPPPTWPRPNLELRRYQRVSD